MVVVGKQPLPRCEAVTNVIVWGQTGWLPVLTEPTVCTQSLSELGCPYNNGFVKVPQTLVAGQGLCLKRHQPPTGLQIEGEDDETKSEHESIYDLLGQDIHSPRVFPHYLPTENL